MNTYQNNEIVAVLRQALDALEECRRDPRLKYEHPILDKAITPLRQVIATEESSATQEPVGIVGQANTVLFNELPVGTPLYTHPPKRSEDTQPKAEQKPLFWYRPCSDGGYEGPIHNDRIEEVRKESGVWKPLFVEQEPKRRPSDYELVHATTWRGLTDEEIRSEEFDHIRRRDYARAIEAKLKEKNTK